MLLMANRLSVAVLLIALLNACAAPCVVLLDTGQGASLEFRPSSSNKFVKVDAEAFEEVLTQLVLNAPLTFRAPNKAGWYGPPSRVTGRTPAGRA